LARAVFPQIVQDAAVSLRVVVLAPLPPHEDRESAAMIISTSMKGFI
jgi:hypothetical protein